MLDSQVRIYDQVHKYRRILSKADQTFALEIECEGDHMSMPTREEHYWTVTHDPSLRGESCEYIMTTPRKLESLDSVVRQWKRISDRSNINFKSKRTSTHVHVNFQHKTLLQTFTACTAFWFLENLLLQFCDEARTANFFCLRLEDANERLDKILQVTQEDAPFDDLWNGQYRYANLNLTALMKFGSLEVRCMDGDATPSRLKVWVKTIFHILENSKHFKDPTELLNFYSENGAAALLDDLLPAEVSKYWKKTPRFEELIDENYSFLLLMSSTTIPWVNEKQHPPPQNYPWEVNAEDMRAAPLQRFIRRRDEEQAEDEEELADWEEREPDEEEEEEEDAI